MKRPLCARSGSLSDCLNVYKSDFMTGDDLAHYNLLYYNIIIDSCDYFKLCVSLHMIIMQRTLNIGKIELK